MPSSMWFGIIGAPAALILLFAGSGPLLAAAPGTPVRLERIGIGEQQRLQFHATGPTQHVFTIEYSEDLMDWVPMTSSFAPDGELVFTEPPSLAQKTRFYRARVDPPNTTETISYHGWSDAIRLANGSVEAMIVPTINRIMQFRFVGEEGPFWEMRSLDGQMPAPDDGVWENFGGDKTWPAPQADWPQVTPRSWPPPKAFDSMSAEATAENGVVTLTSEVDPDYGIRVRRRIELVPEEPVMIVTTEYERVEPQTPDRPVSIWVITQIQGDGATFLPYSESSIFAPEGYTLLSSQDPGFFLLKQNDILTLRRHPNRAHKIGSDVGTLAWVGENLALRMDSARHADGSYPDNGSSAEIYTNPNPDAYFELELLSPLQDLAVGETMSASIRYTLFRRTEENADDEARRLFKLRPGAQ